MKVHPRVHRTSPRHDCRCTRATCLTKEVWNGSTIQQHKAAPKNMHTRGAQCSNANVCASCKESATAVYSDCTSHMSPLDMQHWHGTVLHCQRQPGRCAVYETCPKVLSLDMLLPPMHTACTNSCTCECDARLRVLLEHLHIAKQDSRHACATRKYRMYLLTCVTPAFTLLPRNDSTRLGKQRH